MPPQNNYHDRSMGQEEEEEAVTSKFEVVLKGLAWGGCQFWMVRQLIVTAKKNLSYSVLGPSFFHFAGAFRRCSHAQLMVGIDTDQSLL